MLTEAEFLALQDTIDIIGEASPPTTVGSRSRAKFRARAEFLEIQKLHQSFRSLSESENHLYFHAFGGLFYDFLKTYGWDQIDIYAQSHPDFQTILLRLSNRDPTHPLVRRLGCLESNFDWLATRIFEIQRRNGDAYCNEAGFLKYLRQAARLSALAMQKVELLLPSIQGMPQSTTDKVVRKRIDSRDRDLERLRDELAVVASALEMGTQIS